MRRSEISASWDSTLRSNVFTARDAVFAAAALSLNRQASSCLVSELASDRASLSDRRSSSRRNSATLARLRSSLTRASASSSKDAQSRGSHTGATMGSDHRVSPPFTSVRSVPKSSSRTAMRETVAHARNSYQSENPWKPTIPRDPNGYPREISGSTATAIPVFIMNPLSERLRFTKSDFLQIIETPENSSVFGGFGWLRG